MARGKTQRPVLSPASRIGIVNRAEPAVRFIRAVQEYNHEHGASLSTVAFHLDEEADALFVREADEAFAIGAASGAYLERETLIAALAASRCDGVWPGWGFLSEDARFAAQVARAGMVFLGPDEHAMSLLGDKIAAKDLAESSGVPVLPWSRREISDLADAGRVAAEIGYPVIVKAAHAGGGRGIRFVLTPDELEGQLLSAREETVRVTGGDVVFIERLVRTGRHLEVQCLCDRHGTVLTFGVRDCSVQRRNQKIIEETPPPLLAPARVAEIEEAARRLMAAAGYESAGTVEFLYDLERDEFYFMEVNTRLQVEHPITEILCGVDLVKAQISVAFGRRIRRPKRRPAGVVLEARLNAEDPERDFAPAPGYVRHFRPPAGPGVRVDSGIEQGSTISSRFDSMVAKIIVAGASRADALSRLRRALRETRVTIDGGTTNKAFLLSLLSRKELVEGGVDTKWVERCLAQAPRADSPTRAVALVAAAVGSCVQARRREFELFRQQIVTLGYPRSAAAPGTHEVTFAVAGHAYHFSVRQLSPGSFRVQVDGLEIDVGLRAADGESRLLVAGRRYRVQETERGDRLQVEVDGITCMIEAEAGGAVRSPSPAVVLSLQAAVGDRVEQGQRLLSLEAMKMEMIVQAPMAGVVRSIAVAPGQQVAAGAVLIELEPAETADAEVKRALEPKVDFSFAAGGRPRAEALEEGLGALFTGYDYVGDPVADFDELSSLGGADPDRLSAFICRLLEAFVTVEALFSGDRIVSEQFARTVSWQELTYIVFRQAMQASELLPEAYRGALDRALALYQHTGGMDGSWEAFYRMQRAQLVAEQRRETVRSMLYTLEELPPAEVRHRRLLRVFEEIIRLYAGRAPSLADAALHARYHLYEQPGLAALRRKRSERAAARLDRLASLSPDAAERTAIEQSIIDSSPWIVHNLLAECDGADSRRTRNALSLLARRFVRDRALAGLRLDQRPDAEGVRAAVARSRVVPAASAGTTEVCTVVVVCRSTAGVPGVRALVTRLAIEEPSAGPESREVALLIRPDEDEDDESVFTAWGALEVPVGWLAVGVYRGSGESAFRTYHHGPTGWVEDARKRGFCPLFYRELRVYRFANFETRLLYRSESVHLVAAAAKNNPRDQRLFALAAASESEPRIDETGRIERVTEFDEVFMEAVVKMRSEQSRRTHRLFWNRIIVHVRALVPLSAEQIQEYGRRIVPRTRELGLEKAVIYTRRKRWSEDVVRELELLFLNTSEDQFSLRSRKPSDEPYKPMDRYVSNVVRSRQRRNVYPYEVVRMITHTGYPVSLNVPRGEFEEFDLGSDGSSAVSVKGREYGLNEANLVFGVVRNQDPQTQAWYRRVLILSDSTADMGSLAEGECRRAIAALDLAAERGLPVEWLPISSGARIDMESGTENLDWTAAVLRRIVELTQAGVEINVIVSGINVGAQSYWNAEATMLMHTRGLLIMTDDGSMLLTGKKALDFSGSVSAETNVEIGGVERIMAPNGQAQVWVPTLADAYGVLFRHYRYTCPEAPGGRPVRASTADSDRRDVGVTAYDDRLGQGFTTIGDLFSAAHNAERKKPFDMRQIMRALIDCDAGYLERWGSMRDAETAITWETRIGGYGTGLIGIESRSLGRLGDVPHDGPESWSGGTLFPQSSKKVARAINAWSGRIPVVVLANLSGFDGSPESLRRLQLEYGAEIGRAVVNFSGPIVFVVVARYHGGAYVVFSKRLNPSLTVLALEGSFASVLGGAPAAAVVFPRLVEQQTQADARYQEAVRRLRDDPDFTQRDFEEAYRQVHAEKQNEVAQRFDGIHNVERARQVGSIDRVIPVSELRPAVIAIIGAGYR